MKATDQKEAFEPFKFKALKVYTSTEWLAGNKKKYRQVFDRTEVSFIYVELSLANKLYDEADWMVDIHLKCFNAKGNTEICDLHYNKKVNKYDQILYVREGWGNKSKSSFWKRGTYYWEAWIGGKKISTKYFYIEESDTKSAIDQERNLPERYATVKSIRLFEGPYDDQPEEDRRYLKAFNKDETRYIYCDVELNNNNQRRKWHCELFIKFYNAARELKGQVIKLVRVQGMDPDIEITAGWGANRPGSWREGSYTAEFVFMDQLIAVIPFSVGDQVVPGDVQMLLPGWPNFLLPHSEKMEEEFSNWQKKLDELIGLQEIKDKIRDHSLYIKFLRLRRSKGIKDKTAINIHSVFIGNPGTGKTTVAKMIGNLYHNMGLLSRGHVHEVDRVDLVGEYIGQTAPKVKEAIDNARGGVLFIDEAYALARKNDDSKDFGKEVIEILIKEMSNGPGDLAVIVAGYPEEMEFFLDSNPGLKSRFKHVFEFRDYLPEELMDIAVYLAEKQKVKLSPGAKNALQKIIIRAFRKRDKSFGNARFVHDLIEKAKINLGLRIMKTEEPDALSKRELLTILKEDVLNIQHAFIKPRLQLPIDEEELKYALKELDKLVGLEKVKKSVHELVDLVRYHLERGHDVLNYFNLHTLLIGNPGTGKTTVARILAGIYKALGILERGHLVETDRQGMVAGYVGQTAIKTDEKVNEAVGGVLFIDEAYALSQPSQSTSSDFGSEVIQVLIKRMEDRKKDFFLFAAGYPDNMELFLNSNPGFKSRFDQLLYFEDYSVEELLQIFRNMLDAANYRIADKALQEVRTQIVELHDNRDKYFGNARRIRLMADQIIRNHNLRAAKSPDDVSTVIELGDVKGTQDAPSEWKAPKKTIGFQKSSGKASS